MKRMDLRTVAETYDEDFCRDGDTRTQRLSISSEVEFQGRFYPDADRRQTSSSGIKGPHLVLTEKMLLVDTMYVKDFPDPPCSSSPTMVSRLTRRFMRKFCSDWSRRPLTGAAIGKRR